MCQLMSECHVLEMLPARRVRASLGMTYRVFGAYLERQVALEAGDGPRPS